MSIESKNLHYETNFNTNVIVGDQSDIDQLTSHVADTEIHISSEDREKLDSLSVVAEHILDTNNPHNVTVSQLTTDSNHRFVTDTEISTWNKVTSKADTSALTAHTLSSSAHVLPSDRTKWDSVTSKADKSDLNSYLPLSGGTVTGDLKLSKSNVGKTSDYTISSLNWYSTNSDFEFDPYTGSITRAVKIGSDTKKSLEQYFMPGPDNRQFTNRLALIDEIPTKTSQLTNDSGFITSSDIPSGDYLPLSGGTMLSSASIKIDGDPNDNEYLSIDHSGITYHIGGSDQWKIDSIGNFETWGSIKFPFGSSPNMPAFNGQTFVLGCGSNGTVDLPYVYDGKNHTLAMIDDLSGYLPLSGGTTYEKAVVKFQGQESIEEYFKIDGHGLSSHIYGQDRLLIDADPDVLGAFVPREYQNGSTLKGTINMGPGSNPWISFNNFELNVNNPAANDYYGDINVTHGYCLNGSTNYQDGLIHYRGAEINLPESSGTLVINSEISNFLSNQYQGGSDNKGTITFGDGQYPYVTFDNFQMYVNYPGASDSWGDINVNHGYSLNGSTNYQDGQIWYRNNIFEFPSSSGQLALTSDIPTVPTKTSQLTFDSLSNLTNTNDKIAIGKNLYNGASTASKNITIGNEVSANGNNSIAIGLSSYTGVNGVVIGNGAHAGSNGVAIGNGAYLSGTNAMTPIKAIAIGFNAIATGTNGVQIGTGVNKNLSSLQFMDTTVVLSGRTADTIIDLGTTSLITGTKEHVEKFPGTMLRDTNEYVYIPVWCESGSLPEYYVSMNPDEYKAFVLDVNWSGNTYTKTEVSIPKINGDAANPFVAQKFTEGGTDLSNKYVTTGTTQTISGQKTFSGSNTFTNNVTINGTGYVDFAGNDIGIDFTGTNQYIWFEGTGQNYIEFYAPDAKINFFESGTESIVFSDTKTLKDHLAEADHMPAIATSTSPTINVVAGTKIYKHTVTSSPISLGGIAQNWTDANHALEIELWLTVPTSGTTVVLPGAPTWEWLETPDLTTTVDNQVLYISIRKTTTKTFANLYHTGV